MNNDIVTSMNINTPLFGVITSNRLTKVNISLDVMGLAVVETESYLTKDGEEAITNEFARLKESHTFVPTAIFKDMIEQLEFQAKESFHKLNPNAPPLDIYSKYTRYHGEHKPFLMG